MGAGAKGVLVVEPGLGVGVEPGDVVGMVGGGVFAGEVEDYLVHWERWWLVWLEGGLRREGQGNGKGNIYIYRGEGGRRCVEQVC